MSLFNPWVLLGLVVALSASLVGGMSFQDDRHQAALLVQERAMHDAYVRKVAEYRLHAQHVAKELNDETTKRQSDAVAFRTELARAKAGAVQLAVCNPAGTGVRLTGDFGRLFDAGTALGVPSTGSPPATNGAAERSSVFAPEDVLAANAENAEICGELRAQVLGFQKWVRLQGWWKE